MIFKRVTIQATIRVACDNEPWIKLAGMLASAPDEIRERIESADYFFPLAAAAYRFKF